MNGDNQMPDVRKSHPNLYYSLMLYAIGSIALGINFWVFTPTFLVYHLPNWLWGSVFLALGVGKLILLNFYRDPRLLRLFLAAAVGYFFFFSIGTIEPFTEGKGSLQLPILYVMFGLLQLPLLIEPWINPWTKRE